MRKQHKHRQPKPKKRRQARKVPQYSALSPHVVRLLPVESCFTSKDIGKHGIGEVVITRKHPDGHLITGAFLVDTYCLGIKNAFIRSLTRENHAEFLQHPKGNPRIPIAPCCAKSLVLQAVEYAKGLGFAPHPDYRKAAAVLEGIDASACASVHEFGQNGKPFYISGPKESSARIRQILAQLQQSCGEGGYEYVINDGGGGGYEDEFDDSDYETDDDTPTVDDPDEVDALMQVLEEAVPFPVEINAAIFDQMQARHKWTKDISPQAQVTSVDYGGDLAGIHCMLALEGAPPGQDIFVSLTQLNLDPRLPCFGQVRAYQQTRRETLRQLGMLSDRVLEFG